MRYLLSLFALAFATPAFADKAPPPQRYTVEDNRLVLPGQVLFRTGSDELEPESEAALRHIATYLADKSYVTTMRIEGHVQTGNDEVAAQALSEKRALAVARWLVKAGGVDCKRLLPVGFGSTRPIESGSTPEGRAKNTRIDAFNAALRGHAIGGMPTDGGGRVAGDPCT